jgi:hypothetical protein
MTASMTGRPPSAHSSVKRRDPDGKLSQRINPQVRHPAGIRIIPLNLRPRTPPDQRRPQARSRRGHDVVRAAGIRPGSQTVVAGLDVHAGAHRARPTSTMTGSARITPGRSRQYLQCRAQIGDSPGQMAHVGLSTCGSPAFARAYLHLHHRAALPNLAVFESRRRRCAAPLARRQRRALPWRPARRTPGRIPVGRPDQSGCATASNIRECGPALGVQHRISSRQPRSRGDQGVHPTGTSTTRTQPSTAG